MRPLIPALLLLASCAAPAAPMASSASLQAAQPSTIAAGGPEAWLGTRWGMSKREVHNVIPQAVDWVQRYGTDKQIPMFGIENYPIEGTCQGEVNFSFKDGGLSLVFLIAKDNSMVLGADIRCSGIVERGLTGKYGRTANSETDHTGVVTTKSMSWITPSSQVSLSQMQTPVFRNADGTEVYSFFTTVGYQPRQPGVEGKF